MAILSAATRKRLPTKDFALKKGTSGASGSYPIPDMKHARAALALGAKFASPKQYAEIKRKVHEKFPSIDSKGRGKAARNKTPREMYHK